jgi:hypothetical protein
MTETTKIYFAGAIRGGREDKALCGALIRHLQEYGDVLTEHVGDAGLAAAGERDAPDAEIFSRDLHWLCTADVLVAEVSTPSHGVGYEIAQAESRRMPILCLYRELPGRHISAMLAGNPKLILRKYCNLDDARTQVDEFFSSLRGSEPGPS